MSKDNNNNFNYSNSDDLEYEKLALLNYKEFDSEDMYLSQRPSRRPEPPERPARPEIPDMPERPERPRMPERPERPRMPERPERPRMPERPSYRQPPSIPPPFTVPRLPRGMAIPFPGTSEFNVQYSDLTRFNNLERNFKYCLNHFTFIWLWYGRTFWFYPIFINRWSVDGFIWNGDRWIYDNINLNSIFFYQCF